MAIVTTTYRPTGPILLGLDERIEAVRDERQNVKPTEK